MLGATATTRTPRGPPDQAAHDPLDGASQRRGGAVAQPAAERVGEHRDCRTRHRRPAPGCSVRGRSPTSEFTFNAKLTSSGARKSRHVLMYAKRVQRDERPPNGGDRAPVWRRRAGRGHRRIRWWCSNHQCGPSVADPVVPSTAIPVSRVRGRPCYTCGRAAESGRRGERCWQALCSRPSSSSLSRVGGRWGGRA
jgi:hypothetical protein